MPDFTGPAASVSQADIDGLAKSLDDLHLPAAQYLLLSAMVAVASRVAEASVPNPVPTFRDQFTAAFTPDHANQLVKSRRPPDSNIGSV